MALARCTGPDFEGLLYFEDDRVPSSIFEPAGAAYPDWYRDLKNGNTLVYYHAATGRYQLQDGNWWDPVSRRSFTVQGNWYQATDGSGYYYYDTTHYQAQPAEVPAAPQVDVAAAKAWLTANFATSRGVAVNLISSNRLADKELAWTMFDYWNAAYPTQAITEDQVGLKAATKEADLAKAQQPVEQFMQTEFTFESYRLAKQPIPGTHIKLPGDEEVSGNVDYYWRGKGDEMGGDAADRKAEKHEVDPVGAYQFARANSTRWFVQRQNTNHLIFHDYHDNDVIRMAVWDWTLGQMVTFYDVAPDHVGDVEEYLRDKGW
jgi:hypothetical protein